MVPVDFHNDNSCSCIEATLFILNLFAYVNLVPKCMVDCCCFFLQVALDGSRNNSIWIFSRFRLYGLNPFLNFNFVLFVLW